LRGLIKKYNHLKLPIHFRKDTEDSECGKALCGSDIDPEKLQGTTNPRRITCPECLEKMKESGLFYECPKCGIVDQWEVTRMEYARHCVICGSIVVKFRDLPEEKQA